MFLFSGKEGTRSAQYSPQSMNKPMTPMQRVRHDLQKKTSEVVTAGNEWAFRKYWHMMAQACRNSRFKKSLMPLGIPCGSQMVANPANPNDWNQIKYTTELPIISSFQGLVYHIGWHFPKNPHFWRFKPFSSVEAVVIPSRNDPESRITVQKRRCCLDRAGNDGPIFVGTKSAAPRFHGKLPRNK